MLNIERDIVVMSFGALIVLAGLALMFYGKSAGNSRIKFANMEFEISTPALVVFLVGCGLFLLPLLLPLQRVGFDGRSVVQPLHFQGAYATPQRASGTEIEPNDHVAEANLIALGEVVRGRLAADDVDYFRIDSEMDGVRPLRVIVRRLVGDAGIRVRMFDQWEKQFRMSVASAGQVTASISLANARDTLQFLRMECCLSGRAVDYELMVLEEP